jgi:hypothetical protein
VRPRSSSAARKEAKIARLTRERDEALEQQTATSEVLSVISASLGELEPVFQIMLERAVRICEARFGTLYRFDGNALHFVRGSKRNTGFVDFIEEKKGRASCGWKLLLPPLPRL